MVIPLYLTAFMVSLYPKHQDTKDQSSSRVIFIIHIYEKL